MVGGERALEILVVARGVLFLVELHERLGDRMIVAFKQLRLAKLFVSAGGAIDPC